MSLSLFFFALTSAAPEVDSSGNSPSFDELKSVSASLESANTWLRVVMVQSGACAKPRNGKRPPFWFHCPLNMNLSPTPGDQNFFVEVDPAEGTASPHDAIAQSSPTGVEFFGGRLRWTPGIFHYGKGLFRTFGIPSGKSCGGDCWVPVSDTIIFRRCSGAMPSIAQKIGVIFQFDGPWRSRQWTTARTRVNAVRISGAGATLDCVAP
jgi:hypothetical protein